MDRKPTGKQPTRKQPASSKPIVVGVDLGGTKIAAAAADLSGRIIDQLLVRTDAANGPAGVVAQIGAVVQMLLDGCGCQLSDVVAVGLGAPGPTGVEEGVVFDAPHLPGWRDVPLRQMLEDRLGKPVHLDNDANAAAIAEHVWGAGQGTDDMVYMTVSTGIGGGLILGGHLYRGAAETAGEIGHMTVDSDGPPCYCGNRGCLESLASGTAIARQAVAEINAGSTSVIGRLVRGNLDAVTARVVQDAACLGDSLALGLFARAGQYLGIGFANLTNLLAPRLIVVGGGVAQAGDLILEPARRVLRERAFRRPASVVEVVEARLGRDTGVLGAVALALGHDYPAAASPTREGLKRARAS